MDKRIILAVAGAGKTYKLCNDLDEYKRNIVIAYTNQNIKNIKNELLKRFGYIPHNTIVLTFDSFIYRYLLRPFESLIATKFGISNLKSEGVEIYKAPEPVFINGKYNFKYVKKERIGHFFYKQRFYCERMPELVLDVKSKEYSLIDIAIENLNRYCDYIFVDEFQDFREKHYEVLEQIIKKCNNIVLVGDYYQHSVSGKNNSGKPFTSGINYERYKQILKSYGVVIDEETLQRSRRCPKIICDFVTNKLKIHIEAQDEAKDGSVNFISKDDEIKSLLSNDEVVKLVVKDARNFKGNFINWSYSKGDTYEKVCVIMTEDFENIDKENFSYGGSEITKNKLYVALTRSFKELYIIKKSDFDRHKNDFQIN